MDFQRGVGACAFGWGGEQQPQPRRYALDAGRSVALSSAPRPLDRRSAPFTQDRANYCPPTSCFWRKPICRRRLPSSRSEEHTSELQSLMRISYAVFCLKKKNKTKLRETL